MNLLFVIFALLASDAFASVDCPEHYPNGNTLSYSDGTLHFQNGNTFRYSDGTFHFPNGNTFRYSDGTLHYQNGNTLRYSDGTFHYPNGNTARYSDGTLHDTNGNTAASGSILISDSFGTGSLKVFVRKNSASFRMNLPWGQTLMAVEVSEAGDVVCEPPPDTNEPTPKVIKVEGAAGSAVVEVKSGHSESAVRNAIQSALDSN